MDLDHPAHTYEPIEHEVTIQPHALRKYCRPVRTDEWGESVSEVCNKLGVSPASLLRARWAGLYSEKFIKGLGGKHCRHRIPVIHSWKTLDPSGPAFNQRPDPLWGALWEFLPDRIPDKFEQTIILRPHYFPFPTNGAPKGHRDLRFRGWRWLCPACKKPTRTIFYPLPPRTLFDDLLKDPASAPSPGLRRAQSSRTPGRRSAAAGEGWGEGSLDVERSMLNVRCSPGGADIAVCRGADIPVRPHLLDSRSLQSSPNLHRLDPPPPTFACRRCHQITSATRTDNRTWNLVVTLLTRGLLFGHEVQKPEWYKKERKRARHRKLTTPPAARRMAVLDLILKGRTDRQIARELTMTMHRVQAIITHLCRQENCPHRHDLAKKLACPELVEGGCTVPQPLNLIQTARRRRQLVEKFLLQNKTYSEIAAETGIDRWLIYHDAQAIYRQHNLGKNAGRADLLKKLSISHPPASPATCPPCTNSNPASSPEPTPTPRNELTLPPPSPNASSNSKSGCVRAKRDF